MPRQKPDDPPPHWRGEALGYETYGGRPSRVIPDAAFCGDVLATSPKGGHASELRARLAGNLSSQVSGVFPKSSHASEFRLRTLRATALACVTSFFLRASNRSMTPSTTPTPTS